MTTGTPRYSARSEGLLGVETGYHKIFYQVTRPYRDAILGALRLCVSLRSQERTEVTR